MFSEVYRTLKPGSYFASYEWVITSDLPFFRFGTTFTLGSVFALFLAHPYTMYHKIITLGDAPFSQADANTAEGLSNADWYDKPTATVTGRQRRGVAMGSDTHQLLLKIQTSILLVTSFLGTGMTALMESAHRIEG